MIFLDYSCKNCKNLIDRSAFSQIRHREINHWTRIIFQIMITCKG